MRYEKNKFVNTDMKVDEINVISSYKGERIVVKYLYAGKFDVAIFPEGIMYSKCRCTINISQRNGMDVGVIEIYDNRDTPLYKSKGSVIGIHQVSSWDEAIKEIAIELKKQQEESNNWNILIGLEHANENLIAGQSTTDSSVVIYDPPNQIEMQRGITVVPRKNFDSQTSDISYGLWTLINVFSDCANHYGFEDGKKNIESIVEKEEKLENIILTKDIEKAVVAQSLSYEIAKELGEIFALFLQHIKNSGKIDDGYQYYNSWTREEYEDKWIDSLKITNPLQALEEGIATYSRRILSGSVKDEDINNLTVVAVEGNKKL